MSRDQQEMYSKCVLLLCTYTLTTVLSCPVPLFDPTDQCQQQTRTLKHSPRAKLPSETSTVATRVVVVPIVLIVQTERRHLFSHFIAQGDTMHYSDVTTACSFEASSLDSFVENGSHNLQTKFERQSLFVSVLSLLSQDYFSRSSHVCTAELYCPHLRVTHKEPSGRHLLYPPLILLLCILSISGSKTETRRAKFSCFIFVRNLQMLFLPFQKTEGKKEKKQNRSAF